MGVKMMESHNFVIAKKWNKPAFKMDIVPADGLSASMDVFDFIDCLAEEVGNPSLIFSKQALKKKLEEATISVIREMKLGARQGIGGN